jgi:hypothetical protein
MAAARMQQAGAAVLVAEQDQVLAERADFSGNVSGVTGKTDRMPISAQQFPHRRAAADLGQLRPGRRRPHGVGGAEFAITLGDVHRRFLPAGLRPRSLKNENLSQSER